MSETILQSVFDSTIVQRFTMNELTFSDSRAFTRRHGKTSEKKMSPIATSSNFLSLISTFSKFLSLISTAIIFVPDDKYSHFLSLISTSNEFLSPITTSSKFWSTITTLSQFLSQIMTAIIFVHNNGIQSFFIADFDVHYLPMQLFQQFKSRLYRVPIGYEMLSMNCVCTYQK